MSKPFRAAVRTILRDRLLDAAAAAMVADLLLDAAARSGATLLVATHDPALLDRLPRHLRLQAGRIAA